MSFTAWMDREVPAMLATDKLPGAAIALIENSAPAVIRTWGLADQARKTPVDKNTRFNVASVSKAVTSWGVIKLAERGRIELDRPVERYLGDWRLPESAYDHDRVTVRRLLSHTAGINTEGVKGVPAAGPAFATTAVLEGRLPPLDAHQRDYCARWGFDPDRDRDPAAVRFPPGEAFHYSNLGFTLLQLLIEQVSGLPFDEFMRDEVLEPLGMRDSRFTPPEPSDPRVASGYGHDGKALPDYRHVALAAAGLYCSIGDLARFACAELQGGAGVVSPAAIDTLYERQCYAESFGDMDFDAALGHFRLEVGGHTFVHHTGGVPGWRSIYGVIPQSGHGFCALINSDGGNEFWMSLIRVWSESL